MNLISLSLLCFHSPLYAQAGALQAVSNSSSSLSDDIATTSITANAIGAVAANLRNYVNKTGDIDLASAGGAVYAFAEVSTTVDAKEDAMELGNRLEELTKTAISNPEMLDAQIQSKKDAITVLKSKLEKQQAEATAFNTAAGIAEAMVEWEKQLYEACTEPVSEVNSSDCPTAVKQSENAYVLIENMLRSRESVEASQKASQKTKKERETAVKGVEGIMSSLENDAEKFKSNAKADDESATLASSAGDATSARQFAERAKEFERKAKKCEALIKPLNPCGELFSTLDEYEASGTVQPAVDAGGFVTDRSPEAQQQFSTMTANMGAKFDTLMLSPFKRGVVWRLLNDLANRSVEATKIALIKAESDLEKTQSIASEIIKTSSIYLRNKKMLLNVFNLLISDANAETLQVGNTKPVKQNDKRPIPEIKLPCLISAGTSNCASLASALPRSAGFRNIPPSIQQEAMKVARLGDAAHASPAGLNAAGMANLKSVASAGPKINSFLENIEIAKKQDAKSTGMAQTDYEVLKSSVLNMFNSVTKKVLKNLNLTPERYLASHSGITIIGKKETPVTAAKKVKNIIEKNGSKSTDPIDSRLINQTPETQAIVEPKKVFKLGLADINTNKEDSIFDIISIRYLKIFILILTDSDKAQE